MCGILFSLSRNESSIDSNEWNQLLELNKKRGKFVCPDSQQLKTIHIDNFSLQFYSTVLHLRGSSVVPQPIEESGNILCWNGEIFGGIYVEHGQNDTQVLMSHLTKADSQEAILSIFSRIEGPYAFVFWQAATKKLWFGRDCLGRRSLLMHRQSDLLLLSSVGLVNEAWEELAANGIYCVDMTKEGSDNIQLFSWSQTDLPLLPFPRLNTTLPQHLKTVDNPQLAPAIDEQQEQIVVDFIHVLSESVKSRVADIPHLNARVAILFSGGIDCTVLAALADRFLPASEAIDLLNVAFENPRTTMVKNRTNKKKNQPEEQRPVYDTPDRITGRASLEELKSIAPDRCWNFVEIDVPYSEAMEHRQHIIDLMFPLDTVMDLSIAMAFWFASRGKGITHIGTILCDGKKQPYHSQARVLLSGLGADEQLGGYSRHREAFRHGSWERLIQEVFFFFRK
ncbi:N-terminal nucleophile aminohydrolase [Rhizopus microsporus var. microsporus]|uniref:N-terminal nucleophile aminohydrolase n=1 Tax=Rhizopus microsporus var. microsporus TaxID=86635 RepID=A0A1X0RE67_RHIZD|nr:N-terminal nucleophile aminohydrolase [Rhizopus microsporus var. microsporus]